MLLQYLAGRRPDGVADCLFFQVTICWCAGRTPVPALEDAAVGANNPIEEYNRRVGD
jgi:hypothetical protein